MRQRDTIPVIRLNMVGAYNVVFSHTQMLLILLQMLPAQLQAIDFQYYFSLFSILPNQVQILLMEFLLFKPVACILYPVV
jgi:hypothetical protein